MRYIKQSGSAAIEMCAAIPILAIGIVVLVQFSTLILTSMQKLSAAESKVASAMRESMSPLSAIKNEWPCLEDVPIGKEGHLTNDTQEVIFVTDPICKN